MNQKPMLAFLAGIFLVFIGYSMNDQRGGSSATPGIVVQNTDAEKKHLATSKFISSAMIALGGVLIAGSLFFVLKKNKSGGRYD